MSVVVGLQTLFILLSGCSPLVKTRAVPWDSPLEAKSTTGARVYAPRGNRGTCRSLTTTLPHVGDPTFGKRDFVTNTTLTNGKR